MPTSASARLGLIAPNGTELASLGDDTFRAWRTLLDDQVAIDDQGPLGSRPTSSSGTPGKEGRYYWSTDTNELWRDYGTGWKCVGGLYADVFANLPAFGNPGRMFFATDTGAMFVDTGTGWLRLNVSPWTGLSFGAHTAAGATTPQVRAEGRSVARLRGSVQNVIGSAIVAGETLLTVPVGYRPAQNVVIPTVTSFMGPTQLAISTAGLVTLTSNLPATVFVYLDGVTYDVA